MRKKNKHIHARTIYAKMKESRSANSITVIRYDFKMNCGRELFKCCCMC